MPCNSFEYGPLTFASKKEELFKEHASGKCSIMVSQARRGFVGNSFKSNVLFAFIFTDDREAAEALTEGKIKGDTVPYSKGKFIQQIYLDVQPHPKVQPSFQKDGVDIYIRNILKEGDHPPYVWKISDSFAEAASALQNHLEEAGDDLPF